MFCSGLFGGMAVFGRRFREMLQLRPEQVWTVQRTRTRNITAPVSTHKPRTLDFSCLCTIAFVTTAAVSFFSSMRNVCKCTKLLLAAKTLSGSRNERERLQDTVRRETRDVSHLLRCYDTVLRYDVLLRAASLARNIVT
jgi:hypothetical protein